MPTIEEELKGITKVERKRGEDDTAWFSRLVAQVDTLPDDQFNALGASTKAWCNATAAAMSKKEEFALPADYTPADGGDGESTPAPPEAPAPETKEEAPKEKKPRKPGISEDVRKFVVANPTAKAEEIVELMKAAGFTGEKEVKKQTAYVYVYEWMRFLRIAIDQGILTPEYLAKAKKEE